MHKSLQTILLSTVLAITPFASYKIIGKYYESKAAQELAAALEKNALREQRKLIAQQSRSVEEALIELHSFGSSGVEAVLALYSGRGLSEADAKSKVIESNKWEATAESVKKLKINFVKLRFE